MGQGCYAVSLAPSLLRVRKSDRLFTRFVTKLSQNFLKVAAV